MYKIWQYILKEDINSHFKPVVRWLSCVNKTSIINEDLAKRLETVSLVGFSEHSGFEVLNSSVKFADRIIHIDTSEVDPLICVLENWDIDLRKDLSSNKTTRRDIMRNSLVVEEDYFVAPMNQKTEMSLVSKILSMCKSYAYMQPIIINSTIDHIKYGATGELLSQNIRNEWLYSNVTSRDESVFQFCNVAQKKLHSDVLSLKDPFMNAKQFCNNQLPFSFADSRSLCEQTNLNDSEVEDRKCFSPKNFTKLKFIAFCIPEEGQQFFYHWQRQRKIWWRKFSANPGRFSLTEILTNDNGQESTEIRAEFPWGHETIETVRNVGTKLFDNLDEAEQESFLARVGKRKVLPHVVESETSLEKAFMVFVCDGHAELPYHNDRRELFRFHRKLAPYKITFAAPPSNAKKADDLKQLSIYLGLNLKKSGVSTLLAPNIAKKSLESQFTDSDCLGVPYIAVLKESTLEDGILGLRSIETTLEENIHVANLTSYVELLIKNY